jgi:hypothetical protein
MRISNDRPMKNGGYFYPFEKEQPRSAWEPRRVAPAPRKSAPNMGGLMRMWRQESSGAGLRSISAHLGVEEEALDWIGATWAADRHAIAIPMHDGRSSDEHSPCGIRLRTLEGRKFAVTGSKSGIFFPYGAMNRIVCDRVFICEEPTDTAACLEMGLFAIGRASCRGGEEIVLDVLSQLCPSDCVVVSDNDGPGFAGANALMERLKVRRTRIVPPGKDLRAFVRDGGTKDVMEAILRNVLWKGIL